MSKQANPTTIGVFVIGAIFLAIAGILTFSKSAFFTQHATFVAYFDSSVTGLDVGAPVQVLGVQVGTVSAVKGVIDPGSLEIKVPVFLQLDRSSLGTTRELTADEERVPIERSVELLVQQGLRAELKQQSLVTGKLFVDLVFDPKSPEHYHGGSEHSEIPSKRGGLDLLAQNIEEIDFEGLVSSATTALESVHKLIGNPEIEELIHNLNELVKNVDAEVAPLSSSAQALMADASTLMKDSDRELAALSGEAQDFLSHLDSDRHALREELLVAVRRLNEISSDYSVLHKTTNTLDELAAAARSIRVLAEYLERHPEALLKGKN